MTSLLTDEEVFAGEDSPQMQRWQRNVRDLERMLGLAETRLAALPKPSDTPEDPAVVNLSGKARYAQLDRDVERGANIVKHEQAVELLKSRLAAQEKLRPKPFTLDDLRAAKLVRTDVGWHFVNRVNRKSVSVKTQYSWCDRYPVDQVLEVRA